MWCALFYKVLCDAKPRGALAREAARVRDDGARRPSSEISLGVQLTGAMQELAQAAARAVSAARGAGTRRGARVTRHCRGTSSWRQRVRALVFTSRRSVWVGRVVEKSHGGSAAAVVVMSVRARRQQARASVLVSRIGKQFVQTTGKEARPCAPHPCACA